MNTYPDQRYSNEHLARKLLELKNKFDYRIKNAHPKDKWKHQREYIVAQIIWLREGGIIRNDIMRDFGLL
jgi:hypothetical protein